MRKKKSRRANEPVKKTTNSSNPGFLINNQAGNTKNFRAASIFMPRRPK